MMAVEPVPGRMPRIDRGQPVAVVVDCAHTPQALEKALATLRQGTAGRLQVLFGQAGERDPGNRPEMGSLAALLADFAIFTTDDPRFEDPMQIAAQIAGGARGSGWREGEHYMKRADREGGVRASFRGASPGGAVLRAGGGRPDCSTVGTGERGGAGEGGSQAEQTQRVGVPGHRGQDSGG